MLNRVDRELHVALSEVLREITRTRSVRAVALVPTDKVFPVGGDFDLVNPLEAWSPPLCGLLTDPCALLTDEPWVLVRSSAGFVNTGADAVAGPADDRVA